MTIVSGVNSVTVVGQRCVSFSSFSILWESMQMAALPSTFLTTTSKALLASVSQAAKHPVSQPVGSP